MDVYITFFNTLNQNRHLHIYNGFSFGRTRAKADVDLFVHHSRPTPFIEDSLRRYGRADRVFCSLSHPEQLAAIRPLITENWVIGGPLVAGLASRGVELPGTMVTGTFESYLGKAELDSTFDFYFQGFVKRMRIPHVFFNCSVGKGCYWSRCKFCDYRYFDSGGDTSGRVTLRRDIAGIVEQLHPLEGSLTANAHLCIPAMPPAPLARILNSKRDKRVWITAFLRADPRILEVVRQCNDRSSCTRILFSVGCESLSQGALDKLNKGTTVDDTLEVTRLILERGGTVVLGIMDHYAFADRQMVGETLESLRRLQEIVSGYPKGRVKFTNNGVTHWPTQESVAEFTADYRPIDSSGYERYVARIPKSSEAFHCNKEIALALVNSGIEQRGVKFVSLQ